MRLSQSKKAARMNHPHPRNNNNNHNEETSNGNNGAPLFPAKIYAMLEDAESNGFEEIVAWQHGGKSFKVYQPEKFAGSIMQVYFSQTKFKSFQRQRE
jgi:hypothetical protein